MSDDVPFWDPMWNAMHDVGGLVGDGANDLEPRGWFWNMGIEVEGDGDDDGDRNGNARQNVHEHSVAATTRRNLRMHRDRDTASRHESVLIEVIDFTLTCDAPPDVKESAFHVIDSLTPDHNASAGDSQIGALSTVWGVTDAIDDAVKRRDVREVLVHQLASARERGAIVCSTGVIARIAGTLDGVDDDAVVDHRPPLPFYIVRQELASLAARMRGTRGARAAFEREARRTYIEELGLDTSVMDPVIAEFGEHVTSETPT